MTALPQDTRYTYADILALSEGKRGELVEGVYRMAPAPSTSHQSIVTELLVQIGSYLKGKRRKVFPAPFGVRLFERKGDHPHNVTTYVEPDISVICDPDKLDERGCKGAPDLVIEVLSPASLGHDRLTKFNLYQRAGVKEYWIVSPHEKTLQVFLLEEGRFSAVGFYGPTERVKVAVLDDCTVDLTPVFQE